MQTQIMSGLGLAPIVAILLGLLLLLIAGLQVIKIRSTTRSRTDADLLASQAMLDRAGQLAGVGVWQLDLAGQQLRWSHQTCQMHDVAAGFCPTLAQALAFYGEGDRRLLTEAVQNAAAGGAAWDLELPLTTALGRSIWVRIVGEPMRHADSPASPISYLVGSMQDVTARRTLEDAMQRKHSLLRSVVAHLPCGLSVYDEQLRLIEHNEQFAEGQALPATFFEGRQPHFDELIAFNQQRGEYGEGDMAERAADRFRQFARSPSEVQFERERPDGNVSLVRAAPMPGGGIIITYTDVTERRHAQAEQSRCEQLLRGAMEAINEAFVLFDNDDRIVFCNDKYRSTYADMAELLQPGTTFEQLVRAILAADPDPDHVARQPPANTERWVAEQIALHRKGDTQKVQQLKDGRWLRTSEHKLPSGHIAGFRVEISELMGATEAAEKASLAKSQFLANTSHEIRTPMNAVLGMLKLLQRTPLTAHQHDYVGKAERAARSLLGLLNDILDFSKVEAGKMDLDLQPLRLDALLRDLAVIMASNLDGKNVALHFDIDPMLPRCVIGDALRLQQVFINLVGNAMKFTHAGEVRVQLRVIERQAKAVSVDCVVSDTGIGIALEHQARIFDGFTQAEASTSRRFGGTGLGLAISQRLLLLMGATLHLSSSPGQGSRFSFRLRMALPDDADQQGSLNGFPIDLPTASRDAHGHTAGAHRRVPPNPQRLAGLRLLVVEDNPANQQVASELLKDEGAVVLLASDGQQALSLLASAKRDGMFDAVLMDVQMPAMDGYIATRLIRHQLQLKVPIIAMTANALGADRQACLDAGMDDFVGKPFEIDHLVATLLRLCSQEAVVGSTPARVSLEPLPALLLQADAAGIAMGEALGRLSGKSDLFVRMVGALTDEAAALPSPVTGPAGAAALHGFRGLAATLGAAQLAELAGQGQRALQSGSALPEGWALRFEAAVRRDLPALAALALQLPRDLPPPSTTMPVLPTTLLPAVTALTELLQACDMAALDAYAALRPILLAEHQAQVAGLDDCLSRLDFAAAFALCQTLPQQPVA